MLSAIWYNLYSFKNVKNTHGRLLFFKKLQSSALTLLKVTPLSGCYSRFLNFTNDVKARKASHTYTRKKVGYKFFLPFLKYPSKCFKVLTETLVTFFKALKSILIICGPNIHVIVGLKF